MRVTIETIRRARALNGAFAANALALISFASLFPLVLLAVTVVGFVTGSNPHFADDIVHHLGLTGETAQMMHEALTRAHTSGFIGSLIALVGIAWSGLSVVGGLRYVVNLPRGVHVSEFRARLLGIPWLFGAALIFFASFALTALVHVLPNALSPLAILVGMVVSTALMAWTFWFLDTRRPPLKRILPGAIVGGIGFEVLTLAGTLVLPRLIAHSSATYGTLGVVFAILAWLVIFCRLVVYCVVLNDVIEHPDRQRSTHAAQDPE